MMIHEETSPLAENVVRIKKHVTHPQQPNFGGSEYRIEDWWDRVGDGSWMDAIGNPACLVYAMRVGLSDNKIPLDNEVLYGKVGNLGHLVHVSEIEDGE